MWGSRSSSWPSTKFTRKSTSGKIRCSPGTPLPHVFVTAHLLTPKFRMTSRDLPSYIQYASLFCYFFFSPLQNPNNHRFFLFSVPWFSFKSGSATQKLFVNPTGRKQSTKISNPCFATSIHMYSFEQCDNSPWCCYQDRELGAGKAERERQNLCSQKRNREGKKEHESRHGSGWLRSPAFPPGVDVLEPLDPWEISIFRCFPAFCSESLILIFRSEKNILI